MTFNTQLVPKSFNLLKSAASRLLPRYKNGSTLDAGCVSISKMLGHDADDRPFGGKHVGSVSSHRSLCFRWKSLCPPRSKIKILF